ncbi:MerR family transcriptional regulator [Caulobacter sp. S45]|jgi:DNA-binding transcriptional MerR regulator|uniref:MerR family transcriptional regulator n=1 Tax=Caulobacter sp. S45 TaxID=1641861 RepID=UPI00131D8C4F|nr:MerR family transcriptional regulator [Caulobacter sp. S45]
MVVAKGPDAFRTISEASDELGVPQHVLRFWETRFSFIRPMKRAGGRRFYRRQDLEVLAGVRTLLHLQGYTIKGVQRLHKEFGVKRLIEAAGGDPEAVAILEAERAAHPETPDDASPPVPLSEGARVRLYAVLSELDAAKARIDALLAPSILNS